MNTEHKAVEQHSRGGRDARIELSRFLFAILILFCHIGRIGISKPYSYDKAYIYVEYFFMLSGYFTYRHFNTRESSMPLTEYGALRYTCKKWRSLVPYSNMAVLAGVLCQYWAQGASSLGVLAKKLLFSIPHAFLFYLCGIDLIPEMLDYTAALWFASALLLTLPLFIYLITRQKAFFNNVLLFLLPLMFYGYICARYGSVDFWNVSEYRMIMLLRSLTGLTMGALVYVISRKAAGLHLSHGVTVFLTALEVLLFAAMVLIPAFYRDPLFDFLMLGLFACYLVLVFSNLTLTRSFHSSLCLYLGRLSIPFYFCHCTIAVMIQKAIPDSPAAYKLALLIGLSLAAACLMELAVRQMKKIIRSVGTQKHHQPSAL